MSEARACPPYFTLIDQESLPPGYCWIKRAEPDGPPFWEVAEFNGKCWYVTGSHYEKYPTRSMDASNAWQIGPRVELPPSGVAAK